MKLEKGRNRGREGEPYMYIRDRIEAGGHIIAFLQIGRKRGTQRMRTAV